MNKPRYQWLLVIAVILIAANLRAPLTSISPVLGMIRNKLEMSHALAGAVTTLPLFAFAVFSVLSPYLARRYGLEQVLLAALLFVSAGLLARPWSHIGLLMAGTAVAGIGIAVSNVLLPALIKRYFPGRLGLMTGVFSVSMNLVGAVAAAVSIPLSRSWGWEWTITLWGLLACMTASYWYLYMRSRYHTKQTISEIPKRNRTVLWRYKLSWQVTLYMGLQSFLFFVIMAWLPDIAAERGIDAATAGWIVSFMQFGGLPFNFVMPMIAFKVKDQRLLAFMSGMMFMSGIVCLFMNSVMFLAIGGALIGIAAGTSFSLAMMFFNMRTHNAEQASELSGMAQSFGYLLACTGPALFGWLHDLAGNWNVPLLFLAVAVIVFIWAGLGGGKNSKLPASGELSHET